MGSDRDFAHVESEVRKHQNIYTIDTYYIMSSCWRSSQPKIAAMKGRFVNIKSLLAQMNMTNWSVNSGRQRVPMRDNVRWAHVQEFGQ